MIVAEVAKQHGRTDCVSTAATSTDVIGDRELINRRIHQIEVDAVGAVQLKRVAVDGHSDQRSPTSTWAGHTVEVDVETITCLRVRHHVVGDRHAVVVGRSREQVRSDRGIHTTNVDTSPDARVGGNRIDGEGIQRNDADGR